MTEVNRRFFVTTGRIRRRHPISLGGLLLLLATDSWLLRNLIDILLNRKVKDLCPITTC